jgi:release factor glutamine methyltransferase
MVYPKKAYFGDHVFLVDEHVYEPAEDTFLIAENMRVAEGDTVLDMGTGCGILAVLAAKKAKAVVAVDVNPYALQCAAKNLFQPINQNERFSLMLFNAPYLPSEPDEEESWIGKAWAGGRNGRSILDRFIVDAPSFLAEEGRIQLVQSSLSDVNRTVEMFGELELRAAVAAQVKVAFESIVLVEAKR